MKNRRAIFLMFMCIAVSQIFFLSESYSKGSEQRPPILELTADRVEISRGEPVTLTWSSTLADSCTIEPDIQQNSSCSGGETIFPQTTTTYEFSATNVDGFASTNLTIVVTSVDQNSDFANSFGMTFNEIQPGTFLMGSPEEECERVFCETSTELQHGVTLTKTFSMQTTEVTQRQWEAVMGPGSNPSYFNQCQDCPVETVAFNDIQSFISTLNEQGDGVYRLPTEAEWEYSCRAGSTTAFANGDIIDPEIDPNLDLMGWYSGNSNTGSGQTTHPVAQKAPNAWGLYDMHGNVFEFCQDWYGDYPSEHVTDPVGPATKQNYGRIYRGGSFGATAEWCRSALRCLSTGELINEHLGFRLVKGKDTDNDGVCDVFDKCPDTPVGERVNTDGCTDTDGDGMPDGWEVANGLDPLVNDADADKDSDGVSNLQEYLAGTDPNVDGCPAKIWEGDYQILTQADIDALNGYTEVTGNLVIGHTGDDSVVTTFESLQGLECLTSVGGSVLIQYNQSLINLEGLNDLRSVGGDFWVSYNQMMNSLDGLVSLTSVEGYFGVGANPSLERIDQLDSLSYIGTWFLVGNNPTLTSIHGPDNMSSANVIGIINSDSLTTIEGFTNLISADGLSVGENPALVSIGGFNSLNSITGTLTIYENISLTTIKGFQQLCSVGDSFKIRDNVKFCAFDAEALRDQVQNCPGGGIAGSILISNNSCDPDGLPNDWERQYFGHLDYGPDDDPDNDGLTNIEEFNNSCNPEKDDTDGDGMNDFVEVTGNASPTDPVSIPEPGNYYRYDALGRVKSIIRIQ